MIIPDVNLLVYAYNADAPFHLAAKRWWEGCVGGSQPVAMILQPGPRHLALLSGFCEAGVLRGALLTDAHIAALAIETQAVVHSNDSDFSRFPGLRWTNPLAGGT